MTSTNKAELLVEYEGQNMLCSW